MNSLAGIFVKHTRLIEVMFNLCKSPYDICDNMMNFFTKQNRVVDND